MDLTQRLRNHDEAIAVLIYTVQDLAEIIHRASPQIYEQAVRDRRIHMQGIRMDTRAPVDPCSLPALEGSLEMLERAMQRMKPVPPDADA